jgi:hypothetical protein
VFSVLSDSTSLVIEAPNSFLTTNPWRPVSTL